MTLVKIELPMRIKKKYRRVLKVIKSSACTSTFFVFSAAYYTIHQAPMIVPIVITSNLGLFFLLIGGLKHLDELLMARIRECVDDLCRLIGQDADADLKRRFRCCRMQEIRSVAYQNTLL
jgi:hypothetical protein